MSPILGQNIGSGLLQTDTSKVFWPLRGVHRADTQGWRPVDARAVSTCFVLRLREGRHGKVIVPSADSRQLAMARSRKPGLSDPKTYSKVEACVYCDWSGDMKSSGLDWNGS